MSHPYSEALAMKPSVSYIPYATPSHEQTGDIIKFSQFEEGNLLENERNAEEDKYISASIDLLSTDNDSDDVSISTNTLKEIRVGSQIHTELNTIDARFKICGRIRETENELKGSELSAKRMDKGLYKAFKSVLNQLNNT